VPAPIPAAPVEEAKAAVSGKPPVVTVTPAPLPTVEAVPLPGSEEAVAAKPAAKPATKGLKTPATKPAGKPATSKPAGKPRKLCWKDGRLDVCP
jgi:hypothetical protein